ncbi:hypothetical protein M8818_005238 [Zalaria obscura]|uniref:Uncharacterized protein n=1 Tax=Zalaria obscura TaxID=2024903 RepID=A0ACC3S9I1_9PEZI
MASGNKDDDSQQQDHTNPATDRRRASEEDNPFIAFRKFADESFKALVEGFNAVPSLLSEARARAEEEHKKWHQEWEKGWEKEGHWGKRWGHDQEEGGDWHKAFGRDFWDDAWGFGKESSEEGRDAARALLRQSREANVGVDPGKIISLYRDDGETFLRWHKGSVSGFSQDHPWLSVRWFKTSPYSPLKLEEHHHTHQHGSMWRAAFEDLLDAHMDKELGAWEAWSGKTNDQKLYTAWAQSGIDWMLGLQCRGTLPPQLPSLYQSRLADRKRMDQLWGDIMRNERPWKRGIVSQLVAQDFEDLAREISSPDCDEKHDASTTTELDVYEQLLDKAQQPVAAPTKKESKPVPQLPAPTPQTTPQIEDRPTLLSTLTTTEQTTLPDGTVTTKVVLKKRFSDGREESTETVSTTHCRQQEQDQRTLAKVEETKGEKENKNGSWFWS